MPRLTVSLTEDEIEIVDENVGDGEVYESKSAFVRECIQAHNRIDQLETENERLKREKQQILDQQQEHGELAKYAETEREKAERRERANLLERARWFIMGYDGD